MHRKISLYFQVGVSEAEAISHHLCTMIYILVETKSNNSLGFNMKKIWSYIIYLNGQTLKVFT